MTTEPAWMPGSRTARGFSCGRGKPRAGAGAECATANCQGGQSGLRSGDMTGVAGARSFSQMVDNQFLRDGLSCDPAVLGQSRGLWLWRPEAGRCEFRCCRYL